MSDENPNRRCGYAALIGAPNAGKSTLLNRLVGAKVSIVTPKVQTTRTRVLGIDIIEEAQVVYVDTPGIFKPSRRLERAMVGAAWQGAADADVVVVLVDAGRRDPVAVNAEILRGLERAGTPPTRVLAALNKVDTVRPPSLLSLSAALNARFPFDATFMISALDGGGVEDLRADIARRMPAGPWLYPEDQISDMPMRLLAAEITREKLFLQLHQELPYALAVETEAWTPFEDGSVRIDQLVSLQRDTQKGMVVGKGGARIRAVREAAQAELQEILDRKVHLFVHVKVRERWMDDPALYREMGLDFDG